MFSYLVFNCFEDFQDVNRRQVPGTLSVHIVEKSHVVIVQPGWESRTTEPCYGRVAPLQGRGPSGCKMGHFGNRHHFYLSAKGTCVLSSGGLGFTINAMSLTSYKEESRQPKVLNHRSMVLRLRVRRGPPGDVPPGHRP